MKIDERFHARATLWFIRIFGAALLVDVLTELSAGVWLVHTGRFYPWRHLGILPLYPVGVLALEWLARSLAGIALIFCARNAVVLGIAVRSALPVLFIALLERYSNHAVLLFLITLFLSLDPPNVTSPSFECSRHPALKLVRAQLVIVYGFSALNKLTHGFLSGESIVHLLGHELSRAHGRLISWSVIATELAIPIALRHSPRVGLGLALVMHLAFSALVPGVASFGIAMVAMSALFIRARERPRIVLKDGQLDP